MKLLCPLLVAAAALLPAALRGETPPNILFIYTDDHSYRTVGCYPESHPWVKTPHIDKLAAKGVRFTHAYIGTWCMPSRATMLTGLHQHGVESMRMEGKYPGSEYDPSQCRFWPSVFREKGYQTAQIGKWHTGTDTGYGRDWDYQVVWNRPRHPSNAGNYYREQLIETNGGEAVMVQGYSTDNYTDWALEYLRGEKGRVADKPWYLWLCYGAVHGPYTPAKRHRGSYSEEPVRVPADVFPPREGKPAYVQGQDRWVADEDGTPRSKSRRRATGETTPGRSLEDWVRQYNEGVRALDEAVGRLVEALKASGQYENTLIVFTADQGFAWGQHGFQSKVAPYDATIRSPMIVSMPGRIPAGKVCETPVGGCDIAPTFFGFAGIELPWKMHGHDLGPLLADPAAEWEHPVLTVMTGNRYGSDTDAIPTGGDLYFSQKIPWYVSLREGKFKYNRYLLEGEIEELYDLDADPEELENLALKKKFRGRVEAMRADAIAELRRTDCGFVDKMPAVGGE